MRVLSATNVRETPAAHDLALLRMWLHPKNHACDPDELACIAINAELLRLDANTR